GEQYELEDLGESLEDDAPKAKLRTVFQGRYLKRTAFVAIFWTMQVIPMFAVYTFAPELLESFGLTGDSNLYGGSLIISALFVIGGVPGLWLVERIGRRKLLLYSFVIATIVLALPAFFPDVSAVALFSALAVFAIASGSANFLQIVYPNELFPTGARA